jgi:serine/threonine protein phosphatase 1
MDGAASGDEHDGPRNGGRDAGMLTCAIGDVHGQIGKLEALLDRCTRYCAGRAAQLVFIGDYVDRGPDSRAVVELLLDLIARNPGGVICLSGNHEAVVLAAATQRLGTLPDKPTMQEWLGGNGGGAATLASYGVEHARDLPPEHLAWMAALPLFHDDGKRFFAHAGVRPGCPLDKQRKDDLLWIREPFLSYTGTFERLIVHGHTPVAARVADLRANRLNLDSGAGYDGPLTAAIFNDRSRDPIAFLTDRGDVRELRADVERRQS